MNRYVCAAVLLAGLFLAAPVARGQDKIKIIGEIGFFSPSITKSQTLAYGTGTDYTDSTDRDVEDFIPPFVPPGNSFLVYLDRECDANDGDPPCWWGKDYRAVPEDVVNGSETRFSIEYSIGIKNNTGGTLHLAILNYQWPAGVDSIHVEDAMLARAFNHTFTGPVQIELEDPLTTQLKVIVYYNLNTLSVESESQGVASEAALAIQPNPGRGGVVTVSSVFRTGESVLVTDLLGRVVFEKSLDVGTASIELPAGEFVPGNYMVARLDARGRVLARKTLQILY